MYRLCCAPSPRPPSVYHNQERLFAGFSGHGALPTLKNVLFLFLIALLLASCKVELYSNLDESEANEMIALLLRNGVECDKQPGQEQMWVLRVDESSTATALEVLRGSGYPKQAFTSMGDIFKREGLVSSPLEERIRFVYALSQELSKTISQIDGVLTARVHIVLPDNNPFRQNATPSAASVFIKHRPDSNVSASIPQVKSLVINSIEGLSYSNVTVVLFESQDSFVRDSSTAYKSLLGIRVAQDSFYAFLLLVGGMIFLVLIVLGGAAFLFRRSSKLSSGEPRSTSGETA